jgi:AcrR family transcriptional regulator
VGTPSTDHQRRTQAERSASTREALLDATIECLVEDGYANTTTARVAERAGLSRGAHLHHFQTRNALVVAAAEHLTHRRNAEMSAAAARLPTGPERTAEGLDLIWSSYASPLFQAAMDLWANARTDPELRGHLVHVERVLDQQLIVLAELLFPNLAGRPDFEPVLEFALATMRGLALLDTLHPDTPRNERQWVSCRALLVPLIDGTSTI